MPLAPKPLHFQKHPRITEMGDDGRERIVKLSGTACGRPVAILCGTRRGRITSNRKRFLSDEKPCRTCLEWVKNHPDV